MEDIIVAAEIGNAKLAVMAARKVDDKRLHVLAVETEPTPKNCVRNGVVCKPTEVVAALNGLLKKLANRLGASVVISKIYVGLNAHTLRTTPVSVSRSVFDGEWLTDDMLADLEQEALRQLPAKKQVLEVSAVTYMSNDNVVAQPHDVTGGSLQVTYAVANVDADVVDKLTQCVAQLPACALADYLIAPKTTAELLTTPDDRQGCAVVDFGAGCTSVTVFVNGALKHFAVIPLGGQHITTDLITFGNLSEHEAESLKRQFGIKYADENTAKKYFQMADASDGTKRTLSIDDFKKVCVARLTEIVKYVMEQIAVCVPSDLLSAGLILTGGLTTMDNCAKIVAGIAGVSARIGSHAHWLTPDSVKQASHNECEQLVGVLMQGSGGCVEIQSKKKKRSGFKNIFGRMEDMFSE